MDIEDFFEEWDEDEDDLAELLEDNGRAVTMIGTEDREDENESRSEDDGTTFKCSRCKKWYHLKARLQTHAVARNLPKNAKPNCLNTRRKPEKRFLPSVLMISLHLSACRVK